MCTALRAERNEHLYFLQRSFAVKRHELLTKPLLFASDAFHQGATGLFGIDSVTDRLFRILRGVTDKVPVKPQGL